MMREIPKWSDVRQAKHFKFGYIYSWTMATCGKYQSQKYKLALNGGVVRVTGHVTQLFKFQTPPLLSLERVKTAISDLASGWIVPSTRAT